MIDLSIIIISWNAKELLRQCLQSIYGVVNSVTFEIIVLDNNSADGSPEMVKKEFPHVELISNRENLGFAAANNIGIKRSNGRYLCLMNSDVRLEMDCMEAMITYMEKHPDIGMIGPKVLNPDFTWQQSYDNFPTYWNTLYRALGFESLFPDSKTFGGSILPILTDDSPAEVEVLIGCFWMIRSAALAEIGLLDELFFMYGEDIDWCKRFHLAGQKVIYFPKAEIVHHNGGSSSYAPIKSYIEFKRSSLLYWKKHYGNIGFLYIFLISLLSEILKILWNIILLPIKSSERKKLKHKIERSVKGVFWLVSNPVLK